MKIWSARSVLMLLGELHDASLQPDTVTCNAAISGPLALVESRTGRAMVKTISCPGLVLKLPQRNIGAKVNNDMHMILPPPVS